VIEIGLVFLKRTSMNTHSLSRAARGVFRRGFTIVEIIVVIVIIGVLATLIAPRLIGRVGAAKTSTALSNANSIAGAINTYRLDTGSLPTGPSVMFLVERPTDVEADKWHGPYMNSRENLLDPWGVEFVLIVPGQRNFDFDVVSYGADKKAGGEGEDQDVTNK